MKNHFYFSSHIRSLVIYLLSVYVATFYAGRIFGSLSTIACALIGIGVLAYRYWNWGYNLSVRDRCSLREFLIGMIPAQTIHVLFYVSLYFMSVFLWKQELYYILPFGKIAMSTFVLNTAYLLIGGQIFSLSITSLGYVMAVTTVSIVVYILLSYICYIRAVACIEYERQEMLQGIQRKEREPFAKRYRFVPFLNILPLFSFLYRHFFDIEYKIRPAILLLICLPITALLYDGISAFLWSLFPNVYVFYSLKIAKIYFFGIFASTVELHDKK